MTAATGSCDGLGCSAWDGSACHATSYCPTCDEWVCWRAVTNDEKHTLCGAKIEWRDQTDGD
jgi:hypothetical protein